MSAPSKYERIERERRFLLAGLPAGLDPDTGFREIHDRYIEGTRLRLREIRDEDGEAMRFKFTQKIATGSPRETRITNLYVDAREFARLEALPARTLVKRRYRHTAAGVDAGVDRFLGALDGLVLAEIEAASADGLAAIPLPPFAHCEVTDDPTFTGGELVAADPEAVLARVRELLHR